MAFGTFKSLGDVALKYQITLRPEPFVQPVPTAVDDAFRRRLEFDKLNAPVTASEQAVSEFLIAPVLHEIWRAYSDALMIWSHIQFGQAPPFEELSRLPFLETVAPGPDLRPTVCVVHQSQK